MLFQSCDRTLFHNDKPVKLFQVSAVVDFAMVRSAFNVNAKPIRVGFDELFVIPGQQAEIG